MTLRTMRALLLLMFCKEIWASAMFNSYSSVTLLIRTASSWKCLMSPAATPDRKRDQPKENTDKPISQGESESILVSMGAKSDAKGFFLTGNTNTFQEGLLVTSQFFIVHLCFYLLTSHLM